MKTCTRCNDTKDDDLFPWKSKRLFRRMPHCKMCQRKLSKTHYNNDKQAYLDRSKSSAAQIRDWLNLYKSQKPCADCNSVFAECPSVMEFDHIPGHIKKGDVSSLIKYGINTVQAEIAKCEIVCANCHRIRTAKRSAT